MAIPPAPYQLGVVVPDLDEAMEELTRMFGFEWGPVIEPQLGEWSLRIVHTTSGPPHMELIQGPPGSPWDATDGARFDHVGWWSDDVQQEKQQRAAEGAPIEVDGVDLGLPIFTYHRLPKTGLRFELINRNRREDYYRSLRRDVPPA
jgi:hypothetical protein